MAPEDVRDGATYYRPRSVANGPHRDFTTCEVVARNINTVEVKDPDGHHFWIPYDQLYDKMPGR